LLNCFLIVCKKCIVQYLEENTNCPKCDILLHQSHPLLFISHDRTLQSIVYKLVANLERDELLRQVKFYDEKNLDYPVQLKEKLEQFNLVNKQQQQQQIKIDNSLNHSSSGDLTTDSSSNTSKQNVSALATNTTNFHRLDEPISVSLDPLEGLQV
jgi:polycomb group RING finger protein 3